MQFTEKVERALQDAHDLAFGRLTRSLDTGVYRRAAFRSIREDGETMSVAEAQSAELEELARRSLSRALALSEFACRGWRRTRWPEAAMPDLRKLQRGGVFPAEFGLTIDPGGGQVRALGTMEAFPMRQDHVAGSWALYFMLDSFPYGMLSPTLTASTRCPSPFRSRTLDEMPSERDRVRLVLIEVLRALCVRRDASAIRQLRKDAQLESGAFWPSVGSLCDQLIGVLEPPVGGHPTNGSDEETPEFVRRDIPLWRVFLASRMLVSASHGEDALCQAIHDSFELASSPALFPSVCLGFFEPGLVAGSAAVSFGLSLALGPRHVKGVNSGTRSTNGQPSEPTRSRHA